MALAFFAIFTTALVRKKEKEEVEDGNYRQYCSWLRLLLIVNKRQLTFRTRLRSNMTSFFFRENYSAYYGKQ